MATHTPGEGTTLGYSTTNGSYTTLANVTKIKPPGGKVPEVSTTYLGSSNKTFRPGKIPEAGEVTLSLNRDTTSAGHILLRTLVGTPAVYFFKVIYNDGQTTPANDIFQGFITALEPGDVEDETNLTDDVTIRITGAVTFSAGTP
jgi:hypothetical protein